MGSAESAAERVATDLLLTDALTGNHDGTPEYYMVDADNVEYLVETVLALAEGERERAAVERAAAEMEAVIASGDVAEVAAFVPGEVGRSQAIARRNDLYEEPVEWLRDYAATRLVLPGDRP